MRAAFFDVLNMRVHAVQYEQILDQMDRWIVDHERGRYIVVANTHSVMEYQSNPDYETAARRANLVIPDGMPLIWMGRYRGFHLKQRADGPGLMLKGVCMSEQKKWRHYFYGATSETLQSLMEQLLVLCPNLQVSGSCAPPFRPLTMEEDDAIVAQINASKPDILWVGLGCPKQEVWMLDHSAKLNVPVMLGVGQAFDLLAKVKSRAPAWMCNTGLEWLYRLLKEPRRLWKRYLINNTWFIMSVLSHELKSRRRKRFTSN